MLPYTEKYLHPVHFGKKTGAFRLSFALSIQLTIKHEIVPWLGILSNPNLQNKLYNSKFLISFCMGETYHLTLKHEHDSECLKTGL
jgi:hypothetical protein